MSAHNILQYLYIKLSFINYQKLIISNSDNIIIKIKLVILALSIYHVSWSAITADLISIIT